MFGRFESNATALFEPPHQAAVANRPLTKRRRGNAEQLGSGPNLIQEVASGCHPSFLMGFSLSVNRHEPHCLVSGNALVEVMAENWRTKLRRTIEERGTNMKAVSLASGLGETAVFDILSKGKDPTLTTLAAIVKHLQLSYDELLGNTVPAAQPNTAPVIGETAAGQWLEPDAWDEAKYPPVPFVPDRYGDLTQSAYRVVGPSMNLKIPDGAFVITVQYWEVRNQPQDGDIVVVERRRDGGLIERTLKEVVIRANQIELTPRSSDERFKEPIIIPRSKPQTNDPLEVEIVALVIGSYTPIGR